MEKAGKTMGRDANLATARERDLRTIEGNFDGLLDSLNVQSGKPWKQGEQTVISRPR